MCGLERTWGKGIIWLTSICKKNIHKQCCPYATRENKIKLAFVKSVINFLLFSPPVYVTEQNVQPHIKLGRKGLRRTLLLRMLKTGTVRVRGVSRSHTPQLNTRVGRMTWPGLLMTRLVSAPQLSGSSVNPQSLHFPTVFEQQFSCIECRE